MGKKATYKDVVKTIAYNYKEIERSIVNQLLLNVPNHYPTEGAYRETVWKSLFEMMIPRKYCIEQGVFIIDSYGNKSREVDLAVFDEMYTPYIFNYGEIKFIPIEAVAAVVQCKSKNLDGKVITEWVDSIDCLYTSMDSVVRMVTLIADNSEKDVSCTQTATRPIKILCSLAKESSVRLYQDRFDILLTADCVNRKLVKIMENEGRSLLDWNNSLNHAVKGDDIERRDKIKDIKTGRQDLLGDLKICQNNKNGVGEENVIMSLIFQLNQLLMVLNNPMLFPHRAYARRFNEILKGKHNVKENTKESNKMNTTYEEDKKEDAFLLAKFDVSGIQEYIFSTNRLRENAGASYQVSCILEELLPKAFQEAADEMKQTVSAGKEACSDTQQVILEWDQENTEEIPYKLRLPEDEKIKAEILYIGGGNAVALFRDRLLFQRAGERLGYQVAVNCQGIHVAAAYIKTNLNNFQEDMEKLNRKLEKVKSNMVRQPVYSAFPVVEQDTISHQPIIECIRQGKSSELVTRIQKQKRDYYGKIHHYARFYPQNGGMEGYDYPEEMDKLCAKQGENSYIAVLHIDGNGMGERFGKVIGEHQDYAGGVSVLRKESKEISGLFNRTYAIMLKKLWDHRAYIESVDEDRDKKKIFQLRPIILDGDDFTILCAAELAVPFAAGFIKELLREQGTNKNKISACAGIAFVHSHFPFDVAYDIAEKSCSRAKKKWYAEKERQKKAPEVGYLDFEIIKDTEAGINEKDKEYRKRPYSIALNPSEKYPDSIESLYDVLKLIDQWPMGRLHKIYQAIPEGEEAMQLLDLEMESRGYQRKEIAEQWAESPLFDALELQGMCRRDLLEAVLTR